MKTSFPGYYFPTDDEFVEIWDSCFFILDANVLLNLYRYTPETRIELTSILEDVSDRIWLPHQAALEYHRNRIFVIQQQSDTYESIQNFLKSYQNKIENELLSLAGRDRHPFVDSNLLIDKITTTFEEILEELRELHEHHPDLINNDPIMETITNLFNGKVGGPYSVETLNQIYRDGKKRFDDKVPPGYKDQDKGTPFQYGDLILWLQVIDYAKENKKPIILVTDDIKDDWWLRIKGKTIGPHPELINEIVSKADISFYMYTADPFMSQAREYLDRQVNQKAIEEIQKIRKRDEKYLEETQKKITSLRANIAQMQAAAHFPIIPDELLIKMRAATQTPIVSDELLAYMRAATQFPTISDKLLAHMQAATKFPTISDEQLAHIRAATQITPSRIETDELEIDEENRLSSGSEVDNSETEE